jgi:hypothetical protein
MVRSIPFALCLLSLLLAACGDDEPSPVTRLREGGKPVTPEELAEALREMGTGPRSAHDLSGAMEEAARALGASSGAELQAAAERARALGERPLTTADVETYLALAPGVRAAGSDLAAVREALATKGLSQAEWGVLAGRILAARMALRLPASSSGKMDPKMAADIETVRPFADRLDAASKSR